MPTIVNTYRLTSGFVTTHDYTITAPAVGNTLLVFMVVPDVNKPFSITDSASAAYSVENNTRRFDDTGDIWCYRRANITDSPTNISIVTTGASVLTIQIFEVSGLDNSATAVGQTATSAANTAAPTVSCSTGTNNEAVFVVVQCQSTSDLTPEAGWSKLPVAPTTTSFFTVYDENVGAAGAVVCTPTLAASTNVKTMLTSFKDEASAAHPYPTLVSHTETAFNNTSNKTTTAFDVQDGDVLVVLGVAEDDPTTFNTPTNSGAAFTWTLLQLSSPVGYTRVSAWSATATVTQSMTVTLTQNLSLQFGAAVYVFRNSNGIGASFKSNALGGAPSFDLTTTRDNSAILMINGDWNAVDGATRAYRTSAAGAFTEHTYYRDALRYVAYIGYYPDSGTLGAKTIGMTAPVGQKWASIAVEIMGSTAISAPPFYYLNTDHYF